MALFRTKPKIIRRYVGFRKKQWIVMYLHTQRNFKSFNKAINFVDKGCV